MVPIVNCSIAKQIFQCPVYVEVMITTLYDSTLSAVNHI